MVLQTQLSPQQPEAGADSPKLLQGQYQELCRMARWTYVWQLFILCLLLISSPLSHIVTGTTAM